MKKVTKKKVVKRRKTKPVATGMFKCPPINKDYLLSIGFIGSKANDKQIANAKRNARRACKLGLFPGVFIVDNKNFGREYPIKGNFFPKAYKEGTKNHKPYIVGGGDLTDFGDPGYLEPGKQYKIVGRAYLNGAMWFFYADGSKRRLTEEEKENFSRFVEIKTFWSQKYIDPYNGYVVAISRYTRKYMDPILIEEIVTGELAPTK